MKVFEYFLVILTTALVAAAPAFSGGFIEEGSVLADSLAFPGEVFVITSDQLKDYTINTVEDILDLIPGVTWWRMGPAGSPAAFSVDGRGWRGITLLVNGHPFADPYGGLPLLRFVPLSRLRRVEVVYSGSISVAPRASSGCVVNIVLEEGGRQGPMAEAGFTNGKGNRRSRRIWFSTPRSSVELAAAYDEYLQDASESVVAEPLYLVGQYDSRSFMADLRLLPRSSEELFLHLQRFEDTYRGTIDDPMSSGFNLSGEDVRYSGFDARLRYRKGGFVFSAGQRMVEMKRDYALTSGLVIDAGACWRFEAAGLKLAPFADASRALFENRISGVYFDPRIDEVRAGLTAARGKDGGLRWRAGAVAGHHSEAGAWAQGEAGFSRGRESGFHQRLILARRLRMPTVEELTQPPIETIAEGERFSSAGNGSLEPELSDEISLGAGMAGRVSIDLFARRERRMIVPGGDSTIVLESGGEGDVFGTRLVCSERRKILGIDCGFSFCGEYNGKLEDYSTGIPEYRLSGGVNLKRSSFKNTETVTLGIFGVHAGPSGWAAESLDGYSVLNASLAVTVMSAVVHIEMRNILDADYQTGPGYRMDRRHFRFGFIWDFFD